MTGHVYKKKRPPEDASEEERVIMHEGDASSSSVASESDRGSDDKSHPHFFPYSRALCRKLDEMLHSLKCQVLIVCLVILNCLVVIVGLLIDLDILDLSSPSSEGLSRALYFINLAMLCLFLCELLLKTLVFGVRMLKHRMELFDLVVVLLALCLGVAFGGRKNSADGIGLLIMLRLWRVTKILNSMVSSVKQDAERRMAKERRARRALEREVSKLREYCLQQECELQMYRVMLQQNNIPQPTVLRPPSAPRTLNVIAEVNELESGASSEDSEVLAPPPEYSETVRLQES